MPNNRAPESFGSWLRQRRKALDLTQAALAQRVGCAEVTIRKLESEVARPSRQIASRLTVCLKIPPEERDLFLKVARGERPVEYLPLAQPSDTTPSPTNAQMPVGPLPLKTVPPPAPLPPESRMPLRRNPLFVGRDADLRRLAQVLTMSETAAIGPIEIAAATGLGGIGKTQLACELVHRYGQFFAGGVSWLSFADPAAVPAEVAACGGVSGMNLSPAFDTYSLEKQIKLVRAAWQQSLPRLLVFDNCEDQALLDAWRPSHGGCRVLLTSRRHHWDSALGVRPVALDVLPRADSLNLLRQFRPNLPADDSDLVALAAELGDLPLALHLAGSFLAKYRHALTPAQYRARLHTPTILDDRSLKAAGLSPTQHVQHVARTFEQSYVRLDPTDATDALALTLLAHAACFAPGESIPRWLLLRTLDLPEDDAERSLLTEDALTRLIDLGLLETDAVGTLRMHRLVVAFVQAIAPDAAAQTAVEMTMLDVANTLNQARDPRPGLALESHLRCITDAAAQQCTAQAAGLLNALGMHLHLLEAYADAQHYVERGLAIRERVLGADHPDTASSLLNMGVVLVQQGQYADARRALERGLAIRERVLGADHPDTVQSLQNFSVVLIEQGQYAEAQRCLERTLEIRERVFGAEHLETARTLQNLAVVLRLQGQYADARSYAERTLEIRERVLGADHPDTARCQVSLGLVLRDDGSEADAHSYVARAVATLEQRLGCDHPETQAAQTLLTTLALPNTAERGA